jgi:uncharacterized Zn-finger protein
MMAFDKPVIPVNYYEYDQYEQYFHPKPDYTSHASDYSYQSELLAYPPQELQSPLLYEFDTLSGVPPSTTSFDSYFHSQCPPASPIPSEHGEMELANEAAQYCRKLGKDHFECTICLQTFTRPFNVRGHVMGVHLKKKPHQCTWQGCSLSFTRKSDLTRHYKGVHLNIKTRKTQKRKYSL